MGTEKCQKCDGTGHADNAQFSCSACHGTGRAALPLSGFAAQTLCQEYYVSKPKVIDRRPAYDEKPVEPKPFTAKPIGDYIVVKRIPEPQGLIVEADIAQDKPINCEVIAVSETASNESAHYALKAIAPGDKVMIRRYSGTEVKVNGEEYTLILIFDVLLKL